MLLHASDWPGSAPGSHLPAAASGRWHESERISKPQVHVAVSAAGKGETPENRTVGLQVRPWGLSFHSLTILETEDAHTAGPAKANPHLKQVRPREGEAPNRGQTLFQGEQR